MDAYMVDDWHDADALPPGEMAKKSRMLEK